MCTIIIFLLVALYLLYNNSSEKQYLESFLDPYSCIMHKNIIKKHSIWDNLHRQRFYDFRYYVPQRYKE